MAYIYKITNDINQKVYIGKTEFSVEKRFKEHCRDYKRERCENRPLYAAMNKYGIEHFHVETIEETDNPEEREMYWIEHYRSFKNGYNATKGGDGKKYLDYDLVFTTYYECGENCKTTAQKLNIDAGMVSKIVKLKGGITHTGEGGKNFIKASKSVDMYDLNGKYLQTFPSSREAARYLIESKNLSKSSEGGYSGHIVEVCKGKRKTCNGYIWKYSN